MGGTIDFCGLSQCEDGSQSSHLWTIMCVIGKQPWENTPRDSMKKREDIKIKDWHDSEVEEVNVEN